MSSKHRSDKCRMVNVSEVWYVEGKTFQMISIATRMLNLTTVGKGLLFEKGSTILHSKNGSVWKYQT